MKGNKVYIYKKPDEKKPYKVIILKKNDWMFHSASFYTIKQFERFLQTFNIKIKYVQTINSNTEKEIKEYRTNYDLIEGIIPFWKLEDLPAKAIKTKALSNRLNCRLLL